MEVLPSLMVVDFADFGLTDSGSSSEGDDDAETALAAQALSRRLESSLRAAKSQHLSCGEVLLPASLLLRIARDVLRMSENEPCGLRGCTLYLNFKGHRGDRRCIGSVRCDPNTVTTFEVYLTLKEDLSLWHSILPQFLRNLTKSGTIVLSPAYVLEKKKLYRSYQE